MIIYKATNKINGKVYIGQTRRTLEIRKAGHLKCATADAKTHFAKALYKYGADNFEWEIICRTNDKKTLNELETYYINKYDSIKHGYNMVDGGNNNIMDIDEVKIRHDETMRSENVRKKISSTMKKRIAEGKFFTAEHRRKLSESAKGNHNFGTGDTRSIGCFCILESGEKLHFHSYRDAWLWWKTVDNPFDTKTECVYQHKIKQSIKLGYYTYHHNRNNKIYEYPKWFKEGGDVNEKVTN